MAEVSLALSLSGNSFKFPFALGDWSRMARRAAPPYARSRTQEPLPARMRRPPPARPTPPPLRAAASRVLVPLASSWASSRTHTIHSRRESSRRRSKAPINRAARSPSCQSWLSRAARRHAAGSDWPGRFPAEPGRRSQVERGPAPNAGIGFGVCPLKVVRSRGAYLNLACTMAWLLLHARIR